MLVGDQSTQTLNSHYEGSFLHTPFVLRVGSQEGKFKISRTSTCRKSSAHNVHKPMYKVLAYLHKLNNRVIYTFQVDSNANSPFPLTIRLAANVGELN